MKIDLHIHTSTGSDGALTTEEVFREASRRKIDLISITDHDAIEHQGQAIGLARKYGLDYITGVELNITFPYQGRSISLDLLGYGYDYTDRPLREKLRLIKEHRETRARQITANLNVEFKKENLPLLTDTDLRKMQEGVDGIMSRPHIADYLIKKGIVSDRQEAFDRYLVKCDVPKYPLSLAEASELIKNAGGRLVLAHPNDPNGTSLISVTRDLTRQTDIIEKNMLDSIDGIECWHSRNDAATTNHYIEFCRAHDLLMTGGSDCHQNPLLMGTVAVPDFVAGQFGYDLP
jgi:predicted metal-dependent phosphoesterase TrpH